MNSTKDSDSVQIEPIYLNLELTTVRAESQGQNGTRSKNIFQDLLRTFGGGRTKKEDQRKQSNGTTLNLIEPCQEDNYDKCVYYSSFNDNPEGPAEETYDVTQSAECVYIPFTQGIQDRDSIKDCSTFYENVYDTYNSTRCLTYENKSVTANQYGEYGGSTWYVADDRFGSLNTRLLDAIKNDNAVEVIRLLCDGASPDATCRATNVSACHAAAYFNSEALFLLLKYDPVLKRKDKFGRTPLHLAAWVGNSWNVAALLKIPDVQDKVIVPLTPEVEEEIKVLRPMWSMIDVPVKAPVTDSFETIRRSWQDSIEHQCRKYMTNIPMFYEGWTALHIASFAAHPNTTRLLLAAGANPNSKDASGRTPLDIAGGKIQGIDVNSYVETLEALIEYGGELNWELMTSHSFDSALHIAVELCSVDAIKILLDEKAPITYCNLQGNTPLHECVLKFYKEPLKILANHKRRYHTYSSADVRDSSGNTVLHTAINNTWLPGVRIALDAGADITCEDSNGLTGLHLAALKGNPDILNEAINAAKSVNAVIHETMKVESPLLCAIRSGNLDCVQTIIDAGAPLQITTYLDPGSNNYQNFESVCLEHSAYENCNMNMILHAATETSNEDVIKFLLDHDQNIEDLLDYKCPRLTNTNPVEFAALHNRFKNFQYLLHRTIAKAKTSKKTFDPSVILDIVATLDLESIFVEIINVIPTAVYIAQEKGHFPLHIAIRHSKKNMILQLIRNGADVSKCDLSGHTAIDLIFEHRSHPTKFISDVLDRHIQTNGHPIHDPACEITVDYSILIPSTKTSSNIFREEGQTKVLAALLKTGNAKDQINLLSHPLIESFLHLKWKTLSKFFYTMVTIYSLFVISVSVYIVSVYYFKDKGPVPEMFNPLFWQFFILTTIYPIVIQELSCLSLKISDWTTRAISIEFWVKFATYTFAAVTPLIITKDSPDTEWRRHFASTTLVLAWLNVMLLLSRTPMSGYYMQMFWKVSTKVLQILFIFSCLIIMFSFCFMVQFHTQHPFDGPWAALVKTLVMMTSEFDYDDTFTKNVEEIPISLQILRVVFVTFLILAAIVLMNLMIGVAVHDVQDLILDGNLRRLEKQIEFLNNLEIPCGKETVLMSLGLYKWFKNKKVPQTIRLKTVKENKRYYSKQIEDLIMNKAQMQFDKIKKKQDILKNDTKLDEILHAVAVKEKSIIKLESKLDDAFKAVTDNKINIKKRSKWDIIVRAICNERDTQRSQERAVCKDKNEIKFEKMFQAISTTEKNITKIEHKLENLLEVINLKTLDGKITMRKKQNWIKTQRFLNRRNRNTK